MNSPFTNIYAPLADCMARAARKLAAPSSVLPAGVAENCYFLADVFPECGLTFFESTACLAYTEKDLPADLATLPLTYHLHLPVDLPWHEGVDSVWKIIAGLVEKVAFLSPHAYILHPPPETELLTGLATHWTAQGLPPRALLLENIQGQDLTALLETVYALDLGLCLDAGHMLAYEQELLLTTTDFSHVHMLHLSAPAPASDTTLGTASDTAWGTTDTQTADKHLPLTELNRQGENLVRALVERTKPDTILMLETFNQAGVLASAAWLCNQMPQWELSS